MLSTPAGDRPAALENAISMTVPSPSRSPAALRGAATAERMRGVFPSQGDLEETPNLLVLPGCPSPRGSTR